MNALIMLFLLAVDKPVHCQRPVGWVYGDECIAKALKVIKDTRGGKFVLTDEEYQQIRAKCYAEYQKIPWTCE